MSGYREHRRESRDTRRETCGVSSEKRNMPTLASHEIALDCSRLRHSLEVRFNLSVLITNGVRLVDTDLVNFPSGLRVSYHVMACANDYQ